ncbi:MAG: aryl-alcohol dehydrogenase-like predicted oxidoreductase [Candidatus Latescibacterota bacterium]
MNYRLAKRAGVELSEVGLGCNRLGENRCDEGHWVDLVRCAADLGVNLFDTAQGYVGGRSEEILGAALGNRDDVYIATKIGHSEEGGFGVERLAQQVEISLRRLRRDCVDLLQFHSPGRELLERCDWAESMEQLQRQGKVRFKAMALDSVDVALWLLQQDLVDFIQITYNIFDISAEEELFALAEEKGVALIVRLTLAQGVLAGKFRTEGDVAKEHRANLSKPHLQRRIEMAEDLRPLAEAYPGGMVHLAHHFSLTPNAVTSIIPGARNLEQLRANVAASNGAGLADSVHENIEALRSDWGQWQGGYWFPNHPGSTSKI